SMRSTMRCPRSASRSTRFPQPRSASARRCAQLVRAANPNTASLGCETTPEQRTTDGGITSDMSVIGRSLERLEDRPLVLGRGEFGADVAFPHMLHLRLVRSDHAHGRLVSIEASAALALPGVAAVWTSADVAEIPPIDFRLTRIEGLAPYRQPILARER